MALKMKIAATLAALTVTSALGTAAYAADYFNLKSKVGESTVMPKADAVKKEADAVALVDVGGGLPSGVYTTFRVRDYYGYYATYYVDVYKMNSVYGMNYLEGAGIVGDEYRLATSLDDGQSVSSINVWGYWTPLKLPLSTQQKQTRAALCSTQRRSF